MPTRPCSEVPTGEFAGVCLDEVKPNLEPTAARVDFCETMSPVWFDCGYWADVHECIQQFALWSDAVLGDAAQCTEGSCEEVEQCLTWVFGG